MKTNALPLYDTSENLTGCCPRFNPEGWDEQELHFEDKLFMKADTRAVMHIPVNMGRVFAKAFKDIQAAGAHRDDDFIVLSRDVSGWTGEHLFSVQGDVPGHEMVRLSGDFLTLVFEGPYRDVPHWEEAMNGFVRAQGRQPGTTYFFYTTCPKCAKVYGKNYVVGVTEMEPEPVSS